MKLVGRKITRETIYKEEPLAIAIVNPVNGTIKFSKKVTDTINLNDAFIGVAYPEKEGEKTYIYIAQDEKEGFKVSKGSVTSRVHARELADTFKIERTEKFSMDVNTEMTTMEEFEDVMFFEVSFRESLGVVELKKEEKENDKEKVATPSDPLANTL